MAGEPAISNDTYLYYEDYEERDALEWKNQTKVNPESETPINHFASISIPEAVWMIPTNINSRKILGAKNCHINRISQYTNTHISHNESKYRIEIWGSLEDVEEALKQWEALAKELLNPKRKKGWEKPEKAPINKKQEKKMERRKKREQEEIIYKTRPKSEYFPFNGYFIFPNTDIPIREFVGPGKIYLNPVRIETKCHIWIERKLPNVIKIVGNSCESVEKATERVKNMFIKILVSRLIPDNGWISLMIEPPRNKPLKVRIADPPRRFHLPYDHHDERRVKLLEPVYEGERIPIVGRNDSLKERPSFNFDVLQKIRQSNYKHIEESLVKAFETVHLFDGEIKSRIRFGHVCLTKLRPLPKNYNKDDPLPVDMLNDKILKNNPKFKFATCLATKDQQLRRLFEVLKENNQEWDGSPFQEFKIRAIRNVPGSKVLDDKVSDREEEIWICSFDIQFNKFKNDVNDEGSYDGRIGLWNAVVNERNLLDINMSCLENDYSWKLNFQTAKRLPNDRFGAQGTFVHNLRFCPKGRLVYSNTREIKVISICEKTKWKYWWRNDYVVEITKYEFWDLSKYKIPRPGVEILLSQGKPPSVSYGVTLYKKSWHDHFAINSNLNTGEAPYWNPYDIMDEKETGGVKALLRDIGDFLNILQSNLPMPTA